MKAPDLRTLVAAERRAPAEPAGAREAVLARVHSTIAKPPGPGGGGGGGGGGWRPIDTFFALSLVGVSAVVAVLALASPTHETSQPTPSALVAAATAPPATHVAPAEKAAAGPAAPATLDHVAPVEANASAATDASSSAPVPIEAPDAAAPVATPEATSPGRVNPGLQQGLHAPRRDPRIERAILDRAQAAIARHDAASALDATREHATHFPRGALVEEREVLRIRALLVLGRDADARAAADVFRKRFPASIHAAALDALLAR